MAIWHKVINNSDCLDSFMEMNWEFHDFREERVTYIAGQDSAEIFLKYDTMTEGVLLKFFGIHGMHVKIAGDYAADWLGGSSAMILPNKNILWIAGDMVSLDNPKRLEELKQYATWVEAEKLIWAVTDGEGSPIEMPLNRIDQTWTINGNKVEKHFNVTPYEEN